MSKEQIIEYLMAEKTKYKELADKYWCEMYAPENKWKSEAKENWSEVAIKLSLIDNLLYNITKE